MQNTRHTSGEIKWILSVALGPLAFLGCSMALNGIFGLQGAQAIGTALWMVIWWVTRPVHVSVTAILPVVINALFQMVPMDAVISQYASETVVLLLGADLVCLPWANTGLDRRLSVKALSLIGPSIKQQIAVWLFASALLSVFLPNAVVCTILTPIAISMLASVGDTDVSKSKLAVPILLAIAWGSGIGGAGSPLGGAMNLVAINYMEAYSGCEFMYIDWVIRMFPFMLIVLVVILFYMYTFKLPVKQLDGTRHYFQQMYQQLGKMKRGELICLVVFLISMLLSFLRPLYDSILPGLKPAYAFLALGVLMFFLKNEEKQPLLTWEHAEKEVMWNMLFLFAGGLALGTLITDTGAAAIAADLISQMNLDGGIATVAIFVVFTCVLAELSSNTAAAAIAVPVVMSVTGKLGLTPVPYWFITAMAFNCAYILPLTVRAVPVAYGMDVQHLFKRGTPLAVISMLVITIIGYLFMTLWPAFSTLPYL